MAIDPIAGFNRFKAQNLSDGRCRCMAFANQFIELGMHTYHLSTVVSFLLMKENKLYFKFIPMLKHSSSEYGIFVGLHTNYPLRTWIEHEYTYN